MHTSAVDRATTTTTSINSRTGLERSRQQAWPGTAKGNGNNHHHGHANLRSSLLWHGEGAFSFYDVRHDGIFHCSLPLAREAVNLASCFSCGVARAEIDDASKNTHVLFYDHSVFPIATYDRLRCVVSMQAFRVSHFSIDGSFRCVHLC
jgi:hypothetical protein